MHCIARQVCAMTAKDDQISLRLPGELKERMAGYAQLTGRSKSHVAMEALREYLAWRTPQVEDLKVAVEAADAGDFAGDDEVRAVFERYAAAPRGATRAKGKPAGKTPTARRRRAAR
jgi:predicted transcriptional regulator